MGIFCRYIIKHGHDVVLNLFIMEFERIIGK